MVGREDNDGIPFKCSILYLMVLHHAHVFWVNMTVFHDKVSGGFSTA